MPNRRTMSAISFRGFSCWKPAKVQDRKAKQSTTMAVAR